MESEKDAAHSAQEAILGEFFSEVAHEIRNLMQTVSGLTELELMTATGQSRERLQRIRQHSLFVGELTWNLLRFSAADVSRARCDVNKCVLRTLQIFSFKASAKVRFFSELDSSNPIAAIPEEYLQLILINLIKNALDALNDTASGIIKISVVKGNNDNAIIRVWNSGPPISESDLPVIFERFFSTKEPSRGTGLGLAIVLRLTRQFQGSLAAHNVKTGGVSFELTLPTAQPDGAEEAETSMDCQFAGLHDKRVLIIDDDDGVQQILKLMIVEMGGGVAEVCGTGEEALKLLKGMDFDAILLDVRLRNESGIAIYKQMPDPLKSRVIFITGETNASTDETPQPVLLKPLSYEAMVSAVLRIRS